MLHQRWFLSKNMIVVDEYYDTQIFFDIDSRCFYHLTSDKANAEDVLVIKEISAEDAPIKHKEYMEKYSELISTCKGYCGVACIDGTCPKANYEEYMERGQEVPYSCNECWLYRGCVDCCCDGTEFCLKANQI